MNGTPRPPLTGPSTVGIATPAPRASVRVAVGDSVGVAVAASVTVEVAVGRLVSVVLGGTLGVDDGAALSVGAAVPVAGAVTLAVAAIVGGLASWPPPPQAATTPVRATPQSSGKACFDIGDLLCCGCFGGRDQGSSPTNGSLGCE